MKSLFMFTFLLTITNISQSIETQYPIPFADFSFIILENALSDQPNHYMYFNIYNLDVDEQCIYCRIGYFDCTWAGISFIPEYTFNNYRVYQVEKRLLTITSVGLQNNDRGVSNLENNHGVSDLDPLSFFVFWDDGRVIPLENSYSPAYSITEFGDRVSYGAYEVAWNGKLDSKNGIAGLIGWATHDFFGHDWEFEYTLNFWNVVSGKQTMSKKIPRKENSAYGLPIITKIKYSENGRYIIFNESGNEKPREDHFYLEPISFLFDIETQKYLPSNRDVAFTSDDRYYVTERDGLPSLVDATTHEVLQRYDPGATMSACCFSPDDQILYIACDDLKIYQFDSHLPSSVAGNWELMK